MDMSALSALRNIKPPTNKREAQSVIGQAVWLRNFLEARIGQPIKGNAFCDIIADITATIKTKKL